MPDWLHALLKLLQDSALADAVRGAQYVYPVLEASHILGIALLVGPAFAFDLRLLGFGHRVVSVTQAARHLLPVSHVGFAIVVVTGIVLLSSQATVVAATAAAPWKFGLLGLACVNVLVFHGGIYRSVREWTDAVVAPPAARAAAVVSLVAWTSVTLAGRLLAYT